MISETTPQLMIPPPFRFICKVPRKIVAQIFIDLRLSNPNTARWASSK